MTLQVQMFDGPMHGRVMIVPDRPEIVRCVAHDLRDYLFSKEVTAPVPSRTVDYAVRLVTDIDGMVFAVAWPCGQKPMPVREILRLGALPIEMDNLT